jgi:predicted nuclease of predicted toxin-antitoxin system
MRILLETHVPAAVARRLQQDGIDAVTLQAWRGGEFRTATDEAILAIAFSEQRVLVSFDFGTIPTLLELLAMRGRSHAGVVLIHEKTIRPDDIGTLIRALRKLITDRGEEDWSNQLPYLERP